MRAFHENDLNRIGRTEVQFGVPRKVPFVLCYVNTMVLPCAPLKGARYVTDQN